MALKLIKTPTAKRKAPAKKSAVAILKALEKKPRAKNPVKHKYYALIVRAPNDNNGNPRKAWIVWHESGKFMDFINIGHRDDAQAIEPYSQTHTVIKLGLIEITAAVFNSAKKSGM